MAENTICDKRAVPRQPVRGDRTDEEVAVLRGRRGAVRASLACEGMFLTEEEARLLDEMEDRKLTLEQRDARVMESFREKKETLAVMTFGKIVSVGCQGTHCETITECGPASAMAGRAPISILRVAGDRASDRRWHLGSARCAGESDIALGEGGRGVRSLAAANRTLAAANHVWRRNRAAE